MASSSLFREFSVYRAERLVNFHGICLMASSSLFREFSVYRAERLVNFDGTCRRVFLMTRQGTRATWGPLMRP
jgi:hypothetical protein